MARFQTYNPRIKAWVKGKTTKDGATITDVKQKEPKKPFKGVKKI